MRKLLLSLCCITYVVFAARGEAPQNPRVVPSASQRTERAQSDSVSRSATTRARTQNVSVRAGSTPIQQSRSAMPSRSAISPVINKSTSYNKSRSGSVSRSAMLPRATTAVFSDTSKLGTGYNNCRESYNTCMDQFCAAANDTYRRCICSDKYKDFADMEAALSSAKTMLQSFSDNNLANVNMTAAEVSAMNSATAGEAAATADKSDAAAMLDQITDLLSGKSKPSTTTKTSTLDFSNLNFNAALDDIWSGNSGGDGAFNTSVQDLASLTGTELYNKVNQQCAQIAASSCETDAIQQMIRSAYGLLISQDCQAYSKKIDAQKEQVSQKVREASKLLRDARLDEYRSHNSDSVNECIAAVRKDILNDSACGENFKRCLDFTGVYVDTVTGEPIYSPRLFQLASQIKLENPNAPENKTFLAGLDSFKNRTTASLNSCRDDANTVWDAFKRQALIEISQAQDRKLQAVKDECVNTMKDCYDSTTDALNNFDETTSQRTTAISAKATAALCKEKVVACAALYTPSGGVECKFDSNNKVSNADKCGLRELMNFVSSVDNMKISEGCDSSLESYVAETCAPATGDTEHQSPYGCRLLGPEKLLANLQDYAKKFCIGDAEAILDSTTQDSVNKVMQKVQGELGLQMQQLCKTADGKWVSNPDDVKNSTRIELEPTFLNNVYGGLNNFKQTVDSSYNLVAAVPVGASSSGANDTGRSALIPRAAAPNQSTISSQNISVQTQPTIVSGNISLGNLTNLPSISIGMTRPQTNTTTTGTNNTTATPVVQKSIGWGLCLYNSVSTMCNRQNELTGSQGFAVYNSGTNTCDLTTGWYQARCESIGTTGYWDATSRRCYW